MALIKKTTTYTRGFILISNVDHISGLTSATALVAQVSKAGASFTTPTATISELGSGWYKAALTTTDTNTVGDLIWLIAAAGSDPTGFTDQIVGFDPSGGTMTAGTVLDKSLYTLSGTVTTGTNLDKTGYTISGTVTTGTNLDKTGYSITGIAGTVTVGTNLDKTAYSLSQGFPTNFAAQSITSGGLVAINSSSSVIVTAPVTVGTNQDKSGYTISGTVTTGTNLDKTGYSITGLSGTVTVGTNLDKTGYFISGSVTTGTLLDKTGYALSAAGAAAILTQQMVESYAALHTVPTVAQLLLEVRAHHSEKQVSNTSVTIFEIDGATTAESFTLNSTSPTQISRNA